MGEGPFLKEDNAQGTTLLTGKVGYGRVSGRGNSMCKAMERGENNVWGKCSIMAEAEGAGYGAKGAETR